MSAAAVSPRDMVSSGLCIGCGGCVAQARPEQARLEWNRDGQRNPAGDPDWYRRRSEGFSACCPFSPHAMNEDEIARQRDVGSRGTNAVRPRTFSITVCVSANSP